MKQARELGAVLVGERLYHGTAEQLVCALIELGDRLYCFEGLLVFAFEAVQALDHFLETQFDAGRHARRIEKISKFEAEGM